MQPAKRSMWAVTVVVTIAAIIAIGWRWQNDHEHGWQRILDNDARGYHGYLTGIFIDHDLGRQDTNSVFVHNTPSGTLLKYYPGTALCMTPSFLVAHGLALMGVDEADGRSAIYAKCISLGALLFYLIGLLALRRVLLHSGVNDGIVALTVLAVGVGTNLLRFAAIVPGMPHVYAFAMIAVFLLCVQRFSATHEARWAWGSSAAFGLIILIRPVDGVVVLALPLLLGAQSVEALRMFFRSVRAWVPSVLFAVGILFIMPLLWHAQTGHWWEWSYRDEGFYWSHPRMLDVLLSFRQGFLIYTPVFWLSIVSIVVLIRSDRWRGVGALVYAGLITYVISAWWSWTYGDGIGNRAFIDHYAVLGLMAAFGMQRMKAAMRTGATVFASIASLFTCAQLYQYEHGIFHRFSMDREKYAFTFLRFDPALRNVLGGDVETPLFHPNGLTLVAHEESTMEKPDSLWQSGKVEERPGIAHSGTHVCVLDSMTEHSRVFALPGSIMANGQRAHVVVDLMRYEAKAGDSSRALFGLSLSVPGEPSRYFISGLLNPVPGQHDNEWRKIHLELQVPFPATSKDELRFFIWNQDRQQFLIDDMSVKVYAINP